MTEINELTPTLVNSLIERIEVHNNDKSSGHCYVKVDIYFTAVGMIDIPDETNHYEFTYNLCKAAAFHIFLKKCIARLGEDYFRIIICFQLYYLTL